MSTQTKKPLVCINNTALDGHLTPSSYSTTTTTLVDSGTSVSGKLLGSLVRDNVTRISMTWSHLTAEQWAEINNLFRRPATDDSPDRGFTNTVRFYDQAHSGVVVNPAVDDKKWRECEMYVSDRTAGMQRYHENGTVYWSGCSLELTQV